MQRRAKTEKIERHIEQDRAERERERIKTHTEIDKEQ